MAAFSAVLANRSSPGGVLLPTSMGWLKRCRLRHRQLVTQVISHWAERTGKVMEPIYMRFRQSPQNMRAHQAVRLLKIEDRQSWPATRQNMEIMVMLSWSEQKERSRPTKKRVRTLGLLAAHSIRELYMFTESVDGMDVITCVEETHSSLDEYVRLTATNMWANPLELAVMARILDVAIILKAKGMTRLGRARSLHVSCTPQAAVPGSDSIKPTTVEELDPREATQYHRVVGKLRFMVQERPDDGETKARLKILVCYLVCAKDADLELWPDPLDGQIQLDVFSASDHAGDLITRCSTSGCVILFQGLPIYALKITDSCFTIQQK